VSGVNLLRQGNRREQISKQLEIKRANPLRKTYFRVIEEVLDQEARRNGGDSRNESNERSNFKA